MDKISEISENFGYHFRNLFALKKESSLYRDILNIIFNNKEFGNSGAFETLKKKEIGKEKRVEFSEFPNSQEFSTYLICGKEFIVSETVSEIFRNSEISASGVLTWT